MKLPALLLALAAAPLAAAPTHTPTPVSDLIELVEAGPFQDPAWRALRAKKGGADWAAALAEWLERHPHGPLASLALAEQAALEDDLLKAAATLRLARGEGAGTEAGSAAALELARLEYALERVESALAGMEDAEGWPRADEIQPEWLYWKAQCRFVLKGFLRARDDFRHLAAGWPKHPRAAVALLGQAECDAILKAYERAEPVFESLARPGQAFAAQALWSWAGMKVRQGDWASARGLYLRLKREYPASFEATAVDEKLAALPPPQASPTPPASRRYAVQVGAFSRRATADKLAERLRKHRYPAHVQPRRADGRTLHVVKVGPYKTRSQAEQQARRLETREKLPQRIVEE